MPPTADGQDELSVADNISTGRGLKWNRMTTSKTKILEELKAKIEQNGDLPVFSASVNQICSASNDPEADAMSLSQTVLKDANLSIKLLRLANSPYYNRGAGKIGVVSRAIILLGFDTVKNLSLTMKFIESFQNEHPSIEMDKLLVRAYITAGFVRDLALKIGIKDAEESYTCALLHELGEIAVATYLPDKYIELTTLNKDEAADPLQNEIKVLTIPMGKIGMELAGSWDFSSRIVATMDHEPVKITGQITKPIDLNKALTSLASNIVGSLYTSHANVNGDLSEMMANLSKATGMPLNTLQNSLSDSFKISCELAKTYGLPAKKLMPVVADTGDDSRDKLASQFSFFANNQIPNNTPSKDEPSVAVAEIDIDTQENDLEKIDPNIIDPQVQLQFIQDITSLITDSAKLNTVLVKVLEGIHVAAGFSRVVLCLLGMDRKSYAGRIAIGTDKDLMKEFFDRPLDSNKDIFSRVVLDNVDILADDTHDQRWESVLPGKYHDKIGAHSFVASPLKSGHKPVGFVYADKGPSQHRITPEQHRAFIQFIAQARLAFQACR